jgi:hypothetical protein
MKISDKVVSYTPRPNDSYKNWKGPEVLFSFAIKSPNQVDNLDRYDQVTPWVVCREMLISMLVVLQAPIKINDPYGAVIEKFGIPKEELYLIVKQSGGAFKELEDSSKIYISKYEEASNSKETLFHRVHNDPAAMVVELDPLWTKSTLALSIITLLIRKMISDLSVIKRHASLEEYAIGLRARGITGVITSLCEVDLCDVLRNIDEIVGEDFISGFNDSMLDYSKIDRLDYSGPIFHNLGCNCGLRTFSYRVQKSIEHVDSKTKLIDVPLVRRMAEGPNNGRKWVLNYLEILNRGKEGSNDIRR